PAVESIARVYGDGGGKAQTISRVSVPPSAVRLAMFLGRSRMARRLVDREPELVFGGKAEAGFYPARLIDLYGAEPVRQLHVALVVTSLHRGARFLCVGVRRDVAELRDRAAHARNEPRRAGAHLEDRELEGGRAIVFRLHGPAPDDEL